MRIFFCFILLQLLSFVSVSQNKPSEEIKISKARLKEAKSIKEIIPEIPANCLVLTFECTANMNGSIATAKNHSDDLNPTTKRLLEMLEKKNKFFISNISSNCPDKLKKEYSFVVTE